MKYYTVFFLLFCSFWSAQKLYSKAYGNPKNPAIVFIHGGPSGNANFFEGTTAKKLSDLGYFVIVYDRRGEGRSKDSQATYTFRESFKDLNGIFKKFHISKANILAHSFGGIVATLFTEKYPQRVEALILADALFSQQETYDHILAESRIYFKNDIQKLEEISAIEKLGKNTAEYRKKCFELASEMQFFDMKNPTEFSEKLRSDYAESQYSKTSFRNQEAPVKFYQNEKRNNIDIKTNLSKIKEKNIPIFAIYGQDDRIFSDRQILDLKNIVGQSNFQQIENASNFIFVDQQASFLNFIDEKLKNQK